MTSPLNRLKHSTVDSAAEESFLPSTKKSDGCFDKTEAGVDTDMVYNDVQLFYRMIQTIYMCIKYIQYTS